MIKIKRVYLSPSRGDGNRFLVDGIWPRGIKKGDAKLSGWARETAPSGTLRKWFGHEPKKWIGFKNRYWKELAGMKDELNPLLNAAKIKTLTLVYAARDTDRNNAVVLKEYLELKLKKRSPRGMG